MNRTRQKEPPTRVKRVVGLSVLGIGFMGILMGLVYYGETRISNEQPDIIFPGRKRFGPTLKVGSFVRDLGPVSLKTTIEIELKLEMKELLNDVTGQREQLQKIVLALLSELTAAELVSSRLETKNTLGSILIEAFNKVLPHSPVDAVYFDEFSVILSSNQRVGSTP